MHAHILYTHTHRCPFTWWFPLVHAGGGGAADEHSPICWAQLQLGFDRNAQTWSAHFKTANTFPSSNPLNGREHFTSFAWPDTIPHPFTPLMHFVWNLKHDVVLPSNEWRKWPELLMENMVNTLKIHEHMCSIKEITWNNLPLLCHVDRNAQREKEKIVLHLLDLGVHVAKHC